jgi:hypothetical protein
MPALRADSPLRPPTRWHRAVVAALLVSGVLALHALGLQGLVPVSNANQAPGVAAVQVRALVRPVAPVAVPKVSAGRHLDRPDLPRRKTMPSLPTIEPALNAAERPQADALRRPPPEGDEETWGGPAFPHATWATVSEREPLLSAAAHAPSASAPVAKVTPTYVTQVSPSFEARYRMQRGALYGEGLLQWRHDGEAYLLRLEARVTLLGAVLTQQSTGSLDKVGLAPQRFVDRRLRRSERAVNFVRPAEGAPPYVSFSARAGRTPWTAGMQDRLSWIMQLSAIAAAWPGGPHLGDVIELDVAGPAGEVQHWAFSVAEVSMGAKIKLIREPTAAYDTAVQVWLDPTNHYQLWRLRLAEARGDALELVRAESNGAP